MKSVLIAMSGGVDSSAAAAILQEQSFACQAVLFVMHGEEDIEGAKAACERLNIPLDIIDVKEQFHSCIVKDFIDVYRAGKTPNPCVRCNNEIKLQLLLAEADKRDIYYLASGHYARVKHAQTAGLQNGDDIQINRRNLLLKGKDKNKDQSYMLYRLTQEQLGRLLLPLGELNKEMVRALAKQYSIPSADKGESQDLCFVPDGDYAAFIERVSEAAKPGAIVNKKGEKLGEHKGLIHYTVGQRKGLGIALGEPHYVISKDAKRNEIVLGDRDDLYIDKIMVEDINLIAVEDFKAPILVEVQTRYRAKAALAQISKNLADQIEVNFLEKEKMPASGQSVVFYQKDLVIGGGIAR